MKSVKTTKRCTSKGEVGARSFHFPQSIYIIIGTAKKRIYRFSADFEKFLRNNALNPNFNLSYSLEAKLSGNLCKWQPWLKAFFMLVEFIASLWNWSCSSLFQAACGYEFTNKLHRMYVDIQCGHDLYLQFSDYLKNEPSESRGSLTAQGFSIQVGCHPRHVTFLYFEAWEVFLVDNFLKL